MSNKKISLLLLISISLLLINTNIVRADGVWEYTFDDGDSIGDWDIAYGNWTVDDGSLLVAECEYVNELEGCANSIWHKQTNMTGNWSFDVLQSDIEESRLLFYFIGNGVADSFEFHPAQGYVLRLTHDDQIFIDYVNDGRYRYSLSSYTPPSNLTGWIHFEITRDLDNEMTVYLNGSEIIRVINSLISTSENINIQTGIGVRFDNFRFPKNQTISGYRILPLFICAVGVIIVYTKKQQSK
ncbi:MAG: hypothetical protein ACTSPA_07205 [Promethearchaeota archaeon]